MLTCAPDCETVQTESVPALFPALNAPEEQQVVVRQCVEACVDQTVPVEGSVEYEQGPGVVPWRVRHVEHGW